MRRPSATSRPAAAPAAPARGRWTSARSDPAAETEETGAAARSPLLMLFIASLFIPGLFPVGPIYLSFYKAILLVSIVPLGWNWLRGRAGPVTPADILFLLFCLWLSLSILRHHGPARIVFIGTAFIEYFGAYLIGRMVICNEARFREAFHYILIMLVVMLPFALIEILTGQTVLKDLVGMILVVEGHNESVRLGFHRVALGFPGPIQFGLVSVLFFANVYFIYAGTGIRRLAASGLVAFMVFSALSSGPFMALALQWLMIGWERVMGFLRARWVLLAGLGIFTYAVLELSLPNGLVRYIVDEVIFNPYGGQNRIDIIKYGGAEILRNPVFGIGLNDWTRAWWMNPTVDNFWIVIGMRYGLPAVTLLAAAIAVSALSISRVEGLEAGAARCRKGYLIALAGLVLTLGTVHIWNPTAATVMMYFGAGAWFYRTEPRQHVRIRGHARPRPGATGDHAGRAARRGSRPAADRRNPQIRPGGPAC